MPATPEIGDGNGFKWLVEIDTNIETKNGRNADGDVGVSREIEINLHGKTQNGHEVFEASVAAVYRENDVDIHAKIIGDDGFFDNSFCDEINAAVDVVSGDG